MGKGGGGAGGTSLAAKMTPMTIHTYEEGREMGRGERGKTRKDFWWVDDDDGDDDARTGEGGKTLLNECK